MKKPNSVCWNITRRCNDKCKFCYRDQVSKDLTYEEHLKIIDTISSFGIKKLTFAGGEPLLVPHIKDLILYAKQKGLIISMTTNAILLNKELQDFCFQNLDWITFSLDGANDYVQSKMTRNASHASRICSILQNANLNQDVKCKFKINTIVSNINQNNIKDIADLLQTHHITRWKLFQFIPLRGDAKENMEQFNISDEDFIHTTTELQSYLSGTNMLLSISNRDDLEKAHFVVFPNGDIKISNGLQDYVLGNILSSNLYDIWENGGYHFQEHQNRTEFIN